MYLLSLTLLRREASLLAVELPPPVVLDVTTVGLWTLDLQPEEGRITVIDRIFSFVGMIC